MSSASAPPLLLHLRPAVLGLLLRLLLLLIGLLLLLLPPPPLLLLLLRLLLLRLLQVEARGQGRWRVRRTQPEASKATILSVCSLPTSAAPATACSEWPQAGHGAGGCRAVSRDHSLCGRQVCQPPLPCLSLPCAPLPCPPTRCPPPSSPTL